MELPLVGFLPPEAWSIVEVTGKAPEADKGKLKIDAVEVRVEPRKEWPQIFERLRERTAAALGPVASLIRNLEPLVKGEPLEPVAVGRKLSAKLRLMGTIGMTGTALSPKQACR